MNGIVFNLLGEVVRTECDEEAWDGLLEHAGLDGAYTSLGGYPDADMHRLVGAASVALGLPPEAIVRWFGRRAIPLLRALGTHRGAEPCLLRVTFTSRAA